MEKHAFKLLTNEYCFCKLILRKLALIHNEEYTIKTLQYRIYMLV